ncbi:glycosyltransferase family 2 protein [Curtobacterium sp. PhB136]|uniref:glycosyltransferase family 2 protein n=1 Tax=Curtobacterium sp. PhB136 TaxID=2485181 RepID=UPI001AA000D3|nr:glycosyltransferase family 2 protein [Curtobacterium sp. PhB136]
MRLVRGPGLRQRRRHGLRRALARGRRLTRTAVVVVNWNHADLTVRAARAVLADGAADDVVVVDNGSSDDSVAVLRRELPDATIVVREHNGGFAAGANAGITATGADIVVLLNNDAVPAPGFVGALRDHLTHAAPEVAAVTGRIVLAGRWASLPSGAQPGPDERALAGHDGRLWVPSPDGTVRLNSTGVRVDLVGNGSDRDWLAPADTVAATTVFGFSGGASALRRSALEDVGLLDESLFMYYEDTELAWRLARRGYRVEYVADAVVEHDHSASSGVRSDLFVYRNARNRVLVALWHAPWPVVGRALVRTAGRALRGLSGASGASGGPGGSDRREARLVLAALGDVVRHLPRHLARRRAESARAVVPSSRVDTGA